MIPQHFPVENPATGAAIRLKILATTDLHMHILGFDYYADRTAEQFGLSRVAALISAERMRSPNVLLFDNGDSLQGGPMGDYLAEAAEPGPRERHPAIVAMNVLGYDAITLGNHDFSFGLPFLRRALMGAEFPVVATNLWARRPLPVCAHALLERRMLDEAGTPHLLRIGVLGFMPPQTTEWEPELRSHLRIADIVESARTAAAALRRQGTDLVIALSHSGIGPPEPSPLMENAATALAAVEGVDAIIAGHTHRLFPSPAHPGGRGVDALSGTLAGKPAVMPGFWGSHLGVIELALTRTPAGTWRVRGHCCRLESAHRQAEHGLVTAPLAVTHRKTLRHFRRRIGRTGVRLGSHFTLLGHDPGLRLVAMAQRWFARRALCGSRWQDLPILSAVAPFRAGGRGGPDHYTDVPAGPLTLRNLADLYVFPNRLCALLVDGAALRDWLERSAGQYRQIRHGLADQPLIDPEFPSYNFDLIEGLQWQFDLEAPARYAPDGSLRDATARRVRDLRHRGQPVRDDQRFVLVTNSYRLADSGLFAPVVAGRPVVIPAKLRTRDVLRRYILRRRDLAPPGDLGFRFVPSQGSSVLFPSSPLAAEQMPELPLAVDLVGVDADGFGIFRLTL